MVEQPLQSRMESRKLLSSAATASPRRDGSSNVRERASELLWVLPPLTCGQSSENATLPEVRRF